MKAPTLDQYIDHAAAGMTAGELRRLFALADRLPEKAALADPVRHPRLAGQADALRRIFSDAASLVAHPKSLGDSFGELGVAAAYLLKGYDRIPDNVPGLGLDDDALIMDRVFSRNQEWLTERLAPQLSNSEISALFQ